MPTLYVIAGPNGVGKTTFAEKHVRFVARDRRRLNEILDEAKIKL